MTDGADRAAKKVIKNIRQFYQDYNDWPEAEDVADDIRSETGIAAKVLEEIREQARQGERELMPCGHARANLNLYLTINGVAVGQPLCSICAQLSRSRS